MSELPIIFNSRGEFQEITDPEILESLGARRAAYDKIRKCADDLKVADAAVAESISNVKLAHGAVTEQEKFVAAMPKISFHDVWRVDK